jgi:hypothetical protein
MEIFQVPAVGTFPLTPRAFALEKAGWQQWTRLLHNCANLRGGPNGEKELEPQYEKKVKECNIFIFNIL